MFGWIRIALLLATLFGGALIWGSVRTIISNYGNMAAKIERLEHRSMLFKQREISYKRRIDRRDNAINASKCKAKINRWIRHPDEVPKKFDPFHNNNPFAPNTAGS